MKIDCRRALEELMGFHDGTLPVEEAAYLREHLHRCPPCMDLLRTYEDALEVLARLRPVEVPDDLLGDLQRRIDEGLAPEGA
jgi:hypothetical protein